MARIIRKNTVTGNSPTVKGKARNHIPFLPGSGQNEKGYWNRLVMRPSRYSPTFKRDPRFPVLDDSGHEAAVPADHVTHASRRGGDRVPPNSGGPIERKYL